MALKIAVLFVVLLIGFLIYVSSRNGKFNYSTSGTINAPAEKIFPYISNFKMVSAVVFVRKEGPRFKKKIFGADGAVGSTYEFQGNREVGAGQIEITKIVPNQMVGLKLSMTKPFAAENNIEYILTPVAGGTEFTITMSGDGGFATKLMTVFIDCEK